MSVSLPTITIFHSLTNFVCIPACFSSTGHDTGCGVTSRGRATPSVGKRSRLGLSFTRQCCLVTTQLEEKRAITSVIWVLLCVLIKSLLPSKVFYDNANRHHISGCGAASDSMKMSVDDSSSKAGSNLTVSMESVNGPGKSSRSQTWVLC